MMNRLNNWKRWAILVVPSSFMLQFGGGCGLSDSQLSGIVTSLVSTGLNTLVTQFITGIAGANGAA